MKAYISILILFSVIVSLCSSCKNRSSVCTQDLDVLHIIDSCIEKVSDLQENIESLKKIDTLNQQRVMDSLKHASALYTQKAVDNLKSIYGHAKFYICESFDMLYAHVNDKLGKKFYGVNNKQALFYYKEALRIRKGYMENKKHIGIVRMYYNIGIIRHDEKEYHHAIDYLDSCHSLYNNGLTDEEKDSLSTVCFLSNLFIGKSYYQIGEYDKALFYLKECLTCPSDDVVQNKRIQHAISNASCYRKKKEYSKGVNIVKNLIGEIFPKDIKIKRPEQADLCFEMGNLWLDSLLYASSGHEIINETAEHYYQLALSYYQKMTDKKGNKKLERIVKTFINLGELYRRHEKYELADSILTNGIQFIGNKDIQREYKASLLINRGETNHGMGKLQSAKEDYVMALEALCPHYKKESKVLPNLNLQKILDQNKLLILLGDISANYFALFKQSGNRDYLKQASITNDSLIALINIMRGDFISDDAKIELAKNAQEALQKAFTVAVELGEKGKDQAFKISEHSKAFVLLEATRLKNVSSLLPGDVRDREKALLAEQNDIKKALVKANGNESVLKDRQTENDEAIRKYKLNIKKKYPQYHNLKYSGAELSIKEIQREMLDDDQALIEYYLQDSVLTIFVITKKDFVVHEVPVEKSRIQQLVTDFRKRIIAKEDQVLINTGYELYSLLLKPANLPKGLRLIIVPDGALNNLPFEALTLSSVSGVMEEQIDNENFVLFEHPTSYCFSANLYSQMQKVQVSRKKRRRGVAIFKPFFHDSLYVKLNNQKLTDEYKKVKAALKPFGESLDKEVQDIRQEVSSFDVFSDTMANYLQFQNACTNYAYIHIPTHGIYNQYNSNRSCISFTQNADTLNTDELLHVQDLYGRHWQLELVFLSACQTATGEYISGEGNISMARGFAYAGAKSIVTTLWNVPVSSKADIASEFYNGFIKNKQSKDIAMAEAKKYAARHHTSPVNWAGFVQVGATDNRMKKNRYLPTLVLLGIFSVLAVKGLIHHKRQ